MQVLPIAILTFAAATLTGLTGCADRPAVSADRATDLVVYSNGEATSLKVDGYRAWGPSIEIERMGDGYRGMWRGHPVDVRLDTDQNRIHGMVGSMPFDLHVETEGEEGNIIKAAGLVGGALSNFEIDDDHISGRVANCAYDLKRKPPESDRYKGYISCGGGPSPSSHIAIPPNVRALPALEQATLFAMLLAT